MLFFRPRLNVLSFKKEENIMMILALQFWAFLCDVLIRYKRMTCILYRTVISF